MDKYICIHGHFYQPPRENPWLEAVELQDSAYPYHDWNKRITSECYAANEASRILDGDGKIEQIVNNYEKISYNFGPTLLNWLRDNAPDVYASVVDADKTGAGRFSGHGSAMAQAYNHLIMPLANEPDKITQVRWGIEDFRAHYGRDPEGMWLPETAVDTASLEVLAAHGIKFTILSQRQAGAVRPLDGSADWEDVTGAKIDPRMAYLAELPSGARISLFFVDDSISHAVAFKKLLDRGDVFANRLMDGLDMETDAPQLLHIATDGESYGHHHRGGDMALAYALKVVEEKEGVHITNYAEYLEKFPPQMEVKIIENTSWSCVHGVERWYRDCGCNTGAHPGWNQQWREPLRNAMDWLRDRLAEEYEAEAGRLFKDPWEARNRYIRVILDRSPETRGTFFREVVRSPRGLDPTQSIRGLKLLEMQRHALLMYTSCGWFFDEISGIETVQVIQYAARAIQLAGEVLGKDFEGGFLNILKKANSNIPGHRNGRVVYDKFVRPSMVDLGKVCAHYAMSSLFEEYGENTSIFCFDARKEDYKNEVSGRAQAAAGKSGITSRITLDSSRFCFAVVHMGDHNFFCGVGTPKEASEYQNMAGKLFEAFNRSDFPECFRLLDHHFENQYNLSSLFRDEQRKIIGQVLEPTREEAETSFRQMYQYHSPLIRFLVSTNNPVPWALRTAADVVVCSDLQKEFAKLPPDAGESARLLEEARTHGVRFDERTLEFVLRKTIEDLAGAMVQEPGSLEALENLRRTLEISRNLPFAVNLRKTQNLANMILRGPYNGQKDKAESGDK
ncbi:MAG: DUF3536 domain-containing protein, partial [Deltaproteobacteria bacterium]|nr:DUF3536 domain-containing protein [Deltaproteobacteria bacterium]